MPVSLFLSRAAAVLEGSASQTATSLALGTVGIVRTCHSPTTPVPTTAQRHCLAMKTPVATTKRRYSGGKQRTDESTGMSACGQVVADKLHFHSCSATKRNQMRFLDAIRK